MDGVLVNSEPVHQRLEAEMFEELGLTLTFEEQQTFVGMSAYDSWSKVIRKYKLKNKPEDLIVRGRKKYWEVLHNTDEVKMMEGAMDLIERLRKSNLKLLLASSATSLTIREVLKKFMLEKHFPLFIGGDQVSASKPHPEIFIRIAERGNADPGECVVIEDASHGITAAKKAGMKAIGFQNHHSGKQDLSHADAVVGDLKSITVDFIRHL